MLSDEMINNIRKSTHILLIQCFTRNSSLYIYIFCFVVKDDNNWGKGYLTQLYHGIPFQNYVSVPHHDSIHSSRSRPKP